MNNKRIKLCWYHCFLSIPAHGLVCLPDLMAINVVVNSVLRILYHKWYFCTSYKPILLVVIFLRKIFISSCKKEANNVFQRCMVLNFNGIIVNFNNPK